jgi:putative FmdB family regulatory protein
MPIYAYKCAACGHSLDILQKMSDPPLADCPACGASDTFKKQLTAAGFQLKGSGWYVTDFRGGNSGQPAASDAAVAPAPASKDSAAPPASAPAPASTPVDKPKPTPTTGSGT